MDDVSSTPRATCHRTSSFVPRRKPTPPHRGDQTRHAANVSRTRTRCHSPISVNRVDGRPIFIVRLCPVTQVRKFSHAQQNEVICLRAPNRVPLPVTLACYNSIRRKAWHHPRKSSPIAIMLHNQSGLKTTTGKHVELQPKRDAARPHQRPDRHPWRRDLLCIRRTSARNASIRHTRKRSGTRSGGSVSNDMEADASATRRDCVPCKNQRRPPRILASPRLLHSSKSRRKWLGYIVM